MCTCSLPLNCSLEPALQFNMLCCNGSLQQFSNPPSNQTEPSYMCPLMAFYRQLSFINPDRALRVDDKKKYSVLSISSSKLKVSARLSLKWVKYLDIGLIMYNCSLIIEICLYLRDFHLLRCRGVFFASCRRWSQSIFKMADEAILVVKTWHSVHVIWSCENVALFSSLQCSLSNDANEAVSNAMSIAVAGKERKSRKGVWSEAENSLIILIY